VLCALCSVLCALCSVLCARCSRVDFAFCAHKLLGRPFVGQYGIPICNLNWIFSTSGIHAAHSFVCPFWDQMAVLEISVSKAERADSKHLLILLQFKLIPKRTAAFPLLSAILQPPMHMQSLQG